jgi:UDP:flavonoid glycosyltransferase YjiC (YdhE family)
MKIAIHTLGTRGDIQPYVALAMGLRASGHDVQMAAPSQFEALVGTRGIRFAHLPGEFLELMESPEAKRAVGGGGGFAAGLKLMKFFKPIAKRLLSAEWEAARSFDPELIVYHPKAVGAPHIAERLKTKTILASPLPGFTPTSAFPSPMLPFRAPGVVNKLSHRIMAGSGNALFRGIIGDWREAELGLPRRPVRRNSPFATLYAYSSHVLPRPVDWGMDVVVTGYWVLDDEEWSPDEALEAFLKNEKMPLYVGFGSMPGLDPDGMTSAVLDALQRTGDRAIVATGGGALIKREDVPHVHFIDGAPHERLFPYVSACVHHGGAGTTAASLRAGKPTAIIPFFGDQPFWGARVAELGVGPPPLPIRKMTPEAMAMAIERVTIDPQVRLRANELGLRLRAEDGVATAVDFINHVFVPEGTLVSQEQETAASLPQTA